MSVGVLLMTHEDVGPALVAAARHVMAQLPLHVDTVEVPASADPAQMLATAAQHARALDSGDGVLTLTDLYGATPCNIAHKLGGLGANVRCVSGLNLPMLLRVLNYADRPLAELAEIAASGGRGGIFVDHA